MRVSWFEANPKKTLAALIVSAVALIDTAAAATWTKTDVMTPSADYHHGLKSNYTGEFRWGDVMMPLYTDSLGFLDSARRKVALERSGRRIVFMGDSFTQGVGVPYEKSFVGLIARELEPQGIEVLNAGAVSWSPKLYYLRTKDLVERVGLRFDELWVFIDISDIQDEVLYESFEPRSIDAYERVADGFMREHSVLYGQGVVSALPALMSWARVGGANPAGSARVPAYTGRARWTYDEAVYQKWGRKGVALARENMRKLSELCRAHGISMNIAVYPWPAQIRRRELRSRQVKIWRRFSEENRALFLNYFPDFIAAGDARATVGRYFIRGDVHWNAAGHELVARKWLRQRRRG
jgi:hypothetical protein